jgi:hypothetical protein
VVSPAAFERIETGVRPEGDVEQLDELSRPVARPADLDIRILTWSAFRSEYG